ncbi:MAG: hypothetical protein ACKVQJ_08405 [Pyrinomonadaceae bacterium]
MQPLGGRAKSILLSAFPNDIEFDADGVLRLDLVSATRIGRGAK